MQIAQSLLNSLNCEWGEFRVVDLFNYERGTRLKKSDRSKGKYPLVTAGEYNQGVKEYISNQNQKIFKNAITIDMFCNSFVHINEFCCDDNVLVLNSKNEMNKYCMQFISAIINKHKEQWGFQKQFRQNSLEKLKISLPLDSKNNPNFTLMQSFIKNIEKEHSLKLLAYYKALQAKNERERVKFDLNKYLSFIKKDDLESKEQDFIESKNILALNKTSIKDLDSKEAIQWQEFKIEDLFVSSNGDFDIQQKHINSKGELIVSAGENEMGIIGRSDVGAKIFEANTLTVDMFGNVFYRNHSYKMVTHARVFSLKFKDPNFTSKTMLYVCTSMKWFKLKFSFANMASWKKIKDLSIFLPTQNDKIAFDFMENFIKAIEKEAIKEVVLFNERELKAYEEVVSG